MRFAFDDHEEVYEAGDALYDPPVTGPTSTLEQNYCSSARPPSSPRPSGHSLSG
jgi:hypothetical protein